MISCKEIESRQFRTHGIQHEDKLTVTKTVCTEMDQRKEKKIQLQKLVSDRVNIFYRDGHYKSMNTTYEALELICFIAPSTMKKVLVGAHDVSREFLYKFTVGLKMTIAEANQYFSLCGGELSEENDYDYVVINALRDRDSADSLLTEFADYFSRKL